MPNHPDDDFLGADLTSIPRPELEALLVDALFLYDDEEQAARLHAELLRRNLLKYGTSAPFGTDD